MKKLIFILMVCSLFAEKVESVEEIKITQESNVLIYTKINKKSLYKRGFLNSMSRWQNSNLRPPAPKAGAFWTHL